MIQEYKLEPHPLSPAVLITDSLQGVLDHFGDEGVQAIIYERDLGQEFNAAALSNDKNTFDSLRSFFNNEIQKKPKQNTFLRLISRGRSLVKTLKNIGHPKERVHENVPINPVLAQAISDKEELGAFCGQLCQKFNLTSRDKDFSIHSFDAEIQSGFNHYISAFHVDNWYLNMIVQYMGSQGTNYIPGILEEEDYRLVKSLNGKTAQARTDTLRNKYNVQSMRPGDILFLKGLGYEAIIMNDKVDSVIRRCLVHAAPPQIPGEYRLAAMMAAD